MDFPNWVVETKAAIAAIESEAAALENELSSVSLKIVTSADETHSFVTDASTEEGRESKVAINSDVASYIRKTIATIAHDVEIVVTRDFLYQRAGIDLRHVVAPFIGEYDSRIEQDGIATVSHQSVNPCDVAVAGQNSIAVPLKLTLLGNVSTAAVHMNIAPRFATLGSSRLAVRFTRLPSVCSNQLPNAISIQVEERAQTVLNQLFEAVVLELPKIDLLPANTQFNATWIDDHVRCLGSHSKLQRKKRPLLQAVPDGYAIGVKIDREYIWQMVRSEIDNLGAKLFSGPTVTGPKSFSLSAGFSESDSIRVGCDVIGWTLTVKININFEITVRNERMVVITGLQNGVPDVHIDIHPDILDWLLGALKDKAEAYIRDQIPNIGAIEKRLWFNSARQLDVSFWDEFAVFAINV